ncbi:cellulose biosynthesis protein BcsO [Pantoea rodasii]|uniref:Cellulose biosynthesis protein BcsO n=1 Tax=Pantoea rodasii TaxID=1076549 RepID=A0A2M9WDN9_9GAMM|nr:cellulose biosynthesis protein BcsO [Pantoea rodasii]ORM62409.1 cellulose biosynthesis protein BcsO [Pantoea rodasii]PJZ05654.1 cellulose biosynthesis protein BcsO [Pantoea rodasii]
MKNYDDLQRFKEKTKTLDIAFKDMSGQSQEADHSQWAIIRQLATDNEPELGSGQRIDLPQPQPIRGDEFTAPAAPMQAAPVVVAPVASTSRGSILDSLAATAPVESTPATPPAGISSLFPPAPAAKSAPSVLTQAPKATHVERQATTSLFPPAPAKPAAAVVPAPAVASAPIFAAPVEAARPAAPAPVYAAPAEPARPAPAPTFAAPAEPARPAAAPSRFGSLFRSRPAEPANISKETPLKPLLEKIALCR